MSFIGAFEENGITSFVKFWNGCNTQNEQGISWKINLQSITETQQSFIQNKERAQLTFKRYNAIWVAFSIHKESFAQCCSGFFQEFWNFSILMTLLVQVVLFDNPPASVQGYGVRDGTGLTWPWWASRAKQRVSNQFRNVRNLEGSISIQERI